MAYSIRRNEVQSPTSSRSPSPVDEADIQDAHARLGQLLDLDSLIDTNTSYQANEENPMPSAGNAEDEEQEFEFRLFSAPSKGTTTSKPPRIDEEESQKQTKPSQADGPTQKLRIRLRSPTPNTDPSQGRFIRAFRGWQYYSTTPSLLGLDEKSHDKVSLAERRSQFENMAVSGEQLTQWATSQQWVSYAHCLTRRATGSLNHC